MIRHFKILTHAFVSKKHQSPQAFGVLKESRPDAVDLIFLQQNALQSSVVGEKRAVDSLNSVVGSREALQVGQRVQGIGGDLGDEIVVQTQLAEVRETEERARLDVSHSRRQESQSLQLPGEAERGARNRRDVFVDKLKELQVVSVVEVVGVDGLNAGAAKLNGFEVDESEEKFVVERRETRFDIENCDVAVLTSRLMHAADFESVLLVVGDGKLHQCARVAVILGD